MAPQAPSVLSPSELSYLHVSLSLQPPIRPDARAPTSFRPLVAETDLLPPANGSARLCFADGTEAIVGVKGEVERTGDARRNVDVRGQDEEMGGTETEECREGRGEDRWIEVSLDVPRQRDDDAMVVFLAQMIHEGLVADGGLRRRLVINERWHWRLYVDILLLSPPQTYPLPLLSLTTHLALLTTRLPAPISTNDEDPRFNDDWDASLPLYASPSPKAKSSTPSRHPPITLLVVSVGQNIFFDPSHPELAVADAVLAVTVGAPSDQSEDGGLDLLAVRTIDPPSRLFAAASEVGKERDGGEGAWKARKGGMSRAVLRRMVGMCVEKGGVGEEVLEGLDGFT